MPFHQLSQRHTLKTFFKEVASITTIPEARRTMGLISLNAVCSVVLLVICHASESMVLTSYTYLTIFDLFSLCVCLLTIWVEQQRPTKTFSFGYSRFEVLAVFASTILAQLGALFILKESIERLLVQPEISTRNLLGTSVLAFTVHIIAVYGVQNKAFNHVIEAASSSWLQEHMSDLSHSICRVVPGLTRVLLPRVNPISLFACMGWLAIFITKVLIDYHSFFKADTLAAMFVATMIFGTMIPMSAYTGKILLQTAPSHMIAQLDKCIREAGTLDGVLEFREEHFWTLAFGKLVGSLHVRIRRDANEQLVLAHLSDRLSDLVSILTVHLFKDEWTRTPHTQVLVPGLNSFQQLSPTQPPGNSDAVRISINAEPEPFIDSPVKTDGDGFTPTPICAPYDNYAATSAVFSYNVETTISQSAPSSDRPRFVKLDNVNSKHKS